MFLPVSFLYRGSPCVYRPFGHSKLYNEHLIWFPPSTPLSPLLNCALGLVPPVWGFFLGASLQILGVVLSTESLYVFVADPVCVFY